MFKDIQVNSEVVEMTREFIVECFPGLSREKIDAVMKHLKETKQCILVDEKNP